MRYLALALYAEGPSDHAFLRPIIRRAVLEVGSRLARAAIEVSEQFVEGQRRPRGASRAESVRRVFGRSLLDGSIDLLFVHTDGGADPAAARRDRIDTVRDRISAAETSVVPVVPVRETEAWALADPDALCEEFGFVGEAKEVWPNIDLDDPDRMPDPKGILRDLQRALQTRRRKRPRSGTVIPAGLGDRVALPALRRLAAFRTFEDDLRAALRLRWNLL